MARREKQVEDDRTAASRVFVLPEKSILRRIVIENEMFTGIVLNMLDMMILSERNRTEQLTWSMMSNVANMKETDRTVEENDKIGFGPI